MRKPVRPSVDRFVKEIRLARRKNEAAMDAMSPEATQELLHFAKNRKSYEQLDECERFNFREKKFASMHYFLRWYGERLRRVHTVAALIKAHDVANPDCNEIRMIFKGGHSKHGHATEMNSLRLQIDSELSKQEVEWRLRELIRFDSMSACYIFTAESYVADHHNGGGMIMIFHRFGIADI